MGFEYLQRRGELVSSALRMGQALGVKEEVAHDSILLMDRTMSTSLQVKDGLLDLLAASSVVIASKQGERPGRQPSDAELEQVTGCQVSIRSWLTSNTAYGNVHSGCVWISSFCPQLRLVVLSHTALPSAKLK